MAKEERSVEQTERTNEMKSQLVIDGALDSLVTISTVEEGIDRFGLTGHLPAIPGTERAKWVANVNKLLARKIVDLMSEMKNASRTGATGFGQLNRSELRLLQEGATALNRGLSPEAAQVELDKMKTVLNKVLAREQDAEQGGGLEFQSEEEAEAANLQPGTEIMRALLA